MLGTLLESSDSSRMYSPGGRRGAEGPLWAWLWVCAGGMWVLEAARFGEGFYLKCFVLDEDRW